MRFHVVKEILPVALRGSLSSALTALALLSMFPLTLGAVVPFWEVVTLRGESLGCLAGSPSERVTLLACGDRCAPIPWQLDERDSGGALILDQGPAAQTDDSPAVVDRNDEAVWMLTDGGRKIRPEEIPSRSVCVVEVRVGVEVGDPPPAAPANSVNYVYGLVLDTPAPRSPIEYVRYDPQSDIVVGARAALGFGGATPRYLAVDSEPVPVNLLDRLKIRASAWFLGVLPLVRSEDDLETEIVAWHTGPIRVIRRQQQRIRLGWGIRSPRFINDTYVSRDTAELPVRLRLNFPPTYFFRAIEILAYLDYRDVRGWRLLAPGLTEKTVVGALSAQAIEHLNQLPGDWTALVGPDVSFVQVLTISPSLSSLDRRLFYRETAESQAPEAVPGERPGVGFRLTRWKDVGSGEHWLSSTSYVLPSSEDIDAFLRQRARRIEMETTVLPLADASISFTP